MHKEWCGSACSECEHPCELDEMIFCSPDCPNLGEDGEFTEACEGCDAYTAFIEEIDIDPIEELYEYGKAQEAEIWF